MFLVEVTFSFTLSSLVSFDLCLLPSLPSCKQRSSATNKQKRETKTTGPQEFQFMCCCSFATVTQTKNRKPRSRFAFCSKNLLRESLCKKPKKVMLTSNMYTLVLPDTKPVIRVHHFESRCQDELYTYMVIKNLLHTIRPLGTIEKLEITALYLPKLQHTNYSTLQNLLRTTIRGLVEPMVLVVQNYVDHTCTSVKRGGRTYLPYTCEEDGEIRHFE